MVEYVILSMTLMAIGIYGLLTKRSLVKILISTEMIAAAASMNFIALSSAAGMGLSQAFLILALSVDTTITAVVVAIIIMAHERFKTLDIGALSKLSKRNEIDEVE